MRAFLLLLVVLVAATLALFIARSNSASPDHELPSGPLVVEVTGHDFFWTFGYPGSDGVFGTGDDFQVDDQLRLPVDMDIVLQLTSDDFVYTLSIPQLGQRQIVVPEMQHELRFRTQEAGAFEIDIDPLCAVQLLHKERKGRVVIESGDDFAAWYRSR